MCICGKQCYSFNRIYKYERSKYYIYRKTTNVHAVENSSNP